MIQRINLIEKQALAFTYERLVQICLVVVAINALLVGFQVFKVARLKPQIELANQQVTSLTQEQEELAKQPVQQKPKKVVNVGQYQQLFNTLDSSPVWSAVLRGLVGNLPNSVWITSLKGVSSMPLPPPKKPGEEDKKPTQPVNLTPNTRVEVSGSSPEVKAIAEFATKLDRSPIFRNVTLANTIKDVNGYVFVIQGDVVPTSEYAK